jgi:uncharacterized protein YjbI with pentapeptide repeats
LPGRPAAAGPHKNTLKNPRLGSAVAGVFKRVKDRQPGKKAPASSRKNMAAARSPVAARNRPALKRPAFKRPVFRNTVFRNTVFRNTVFRNTVFRNTVFRNTVFRNTVFRNTALRNRVVVVQRAASSRFRQSS